MSRFDPRPVVLERGGVRLVPMMADHAAALLEAGRAPEIWEYYLCPQPTDFAAMQQWVADALAAQTAGSAVPFVIESDGRVVGSTRYMEIRRADFRIEIGSTWLAPECWRTSINTTCKFLLLRHAFEELGAARVELKTDAGNVRSRAAIERIGATPEGILRGYQRVHTGRQRDTAMFSITAPEWPAVRARLAGILGEPA